MLYEQLRHMLGSREQIDTMSVYVRNDCMIESAVEPGTESAVDAVIESAIESVAQPSPATQPSQPDQPPRPLPPFPMSQGG